jgi:hypothetical protein
MQRSTKHLRAVQPKPAPIGGLMDSRFVYVPSNKTDIRATFARIREQQLKGQK